ncbi:subunit J of eukaryotic translation initiation factor 3 [Mitosporidium daphniae]|uniref:Eukaryotic translation initiation factor 3 30 kDa subunit n=1 Tax=Mitosporidium daphniae TaxID=1485682 RepID=A0A098VN05_9MICR|nr:subunit J of eukaryotic translation initiation factor 3 [Mitosporidium daphniae]KGG50330.1 subunit J of eukaryotic translation initiation factor 3 [Mitosporidium daphniae]|eukprot:XP_013236771.1 subunit J of eukaryotic translation initiation factor 3 [Mitosporidium daphniae]
MEALEIEKSHSLECANDLLNLPRENLAPQQGSKLAPSRHSLSYSIDEARPKTRDEFSEFQNAIVEKIRSFKESSMYELFLEGCIRSLSAGLELNQLRKVTSEMQTLLNQRIAASKAPVQSSTATLNKKGQKPRKFV